MQASSTSSTLVSPLPTPLDPEDPPQLKVYQLKEVYYWFCWSTHSVSFFY